MGGDGEGDTLNNGGEKMNYETIIFKKENGVATITLNRPNRLNALDHKTSEELLDSIEKCGKDDEIRAVVITGAGRAFSSGGDVKSFDPSVHETVDNFIKELTERVHKVILAIRNLEKPVIASINGIASGAGSSLALACDIRIASESARFNQAFIKIGLAPDSGATYFLPRLIGTGKASELFFTGDFVDAKEAEKMGIVNRVVPEGELGRTTEELATRLAKGPTLAMGRTKRLINLAFTNTLESQLENELQAQVASASTKDFIEGVTAFLGKREPKFEGK